LRFLVPPRTPIEYAQRVAQRSGLLSRCGITVHVPVVPGSGLGCSSALSVALALARRSLDDECPDAGAVAEEAWQIEQTVGSVGKQDHYASAFGGANSLEFTDKGVRVRRLNLPFRVRETLDQCFVLARARGRRDCEILGRQARNCESDSLVRHAIDQRVALVPAFEAALARGDLRQLSDLMRLDWLLKQNMDKGMYASDVTELFDAGVRAGALAGRLLGAGGSGFLLFVAEPERRRSVIEQLARISCDVRPVRLEWERPALVEM